MATLSLTVDDALIPRIRTAYGVATNGQLKQAFIDDIRQKVIGYERGLAAASAATTVKQTIAAQDALVDTATATASSEIVLT